MSKEHPPIYVLRHGETEWNTELRLQGSRDSALTARGRQQAEAMGAALAQTLQRHGLAAAEIAFAVSPLGRTRQTAELVGAALGIEAGRWRSDARLAELGYGDWEGRTVREIEAEMPGVMARWRADPLGFDPPGGETHLQLKSRVGDWLREARAGPRPLVVVGHGVAGAMLRGLYLGLTAQQIFVLEKPQDAFFRLSGGAADRIAVG